MVRSQDGPTPDKWTYYNLGDVTKEQLSERLNTAVAMSFLNTLKQKTSTNGESTKHLTRGICLILLQCHPN